MRRPSPPRPSAAPSRPHASIQACTHHSTANAAGSGGVAAPPAGGGARALREGEGRGEGEAVSDHHLVIQPAFSDDGGGGGGGGTCAAALPNCTSS